MTCVLFHVFAVVFGLLSIFKLYLKLTTGWCYSYKSLVGKTAIVTGANAGIGYYTALDFAKRGGRVILACRDKNRAEAARRKIVEATGNDNVVVKIVDLASFDSVRAFAKDINATEERLDILVNNAAVMLVNVDNRRTEENLELTMKINHYSVFLLTILLIDLLKKSGPSRIVNVSSRGASHAKQTLEEIIEYSGVFMAYQNSKLANILFTQELARRLKGTNVTTYSLHPGVVATEIFNGASGILKIIFDLSRNTLLKTSEEGAQTTIYTALEKGIEKFNGEHFTDCKRVPPYKTAQDEGLAKKLWEKTEQIVKLTPREAKI